MHSRRARRVLVSWIAILAILMATLGPSISHALGAKDAGAWTEICTSLGSKWVDADGDTGGESPVPSGAHPLEHCPCCSLHANGIAVPAAPLAAVPVLLPAHDLPIALLAVPRTLFAWLSAQPRAPPHFS